MNRIFAEKWLNRLKKYWFNKDVEHAAALFKYKTFYQEIPFDKPYTIFEEIRNEWQHIENQNIK